METPPVSNRRSHPRPSSIKARSRRAHPERSPAAPPRRPHSEPAPPANRNSNSVSAPGPASRQSPPAHRRSKAPPRAACGKPAPGSFRPTPQSQCPRDPAVVRDPAAVVPRALPPRAEQNFRPRERCAEPQRITRDAGCRILTSASFRRHGWNSSAHRRVLHHHHRIRPRGSGAPVMIPPPARAQPSTHPLPAIARLHLADNFEPRRNLRQVRRPHRISIANRPRKGRKVAVRHNPSASTRPLPPADRPSRSLAGDTPAACCSTRCRATSKSSRRRPEDMQKK
jgi:hypothetical protein